MLLALLIVNNFGKPRLLKFYRHTVCTARRENTALFWQPSH
jgi:hypothetical protein